MIMVGFDGILRTQSLLLLRVGHVKFLKGQAVLKLVRTKTTMRNGGVQLWSFAAHERSACFKKLAKIASAACLSAQPRAFQRPF